jgi:hypothetical protein
MTVREVCLYAIKPRFDASKALADFASEYLHFVKPDFDSRESLTNFAPECLQLITECAMTLSDHAHMVANLLK